MKKLMKLFLVAMFVCSPLRAEMLNLMVYGDSLSSGYKIGAKNSFANQLETALQGKGYPVTVVNYSQAGATSADGVHRLKGALAKKVDGVLLALGANDMLRHIDIETTKKNLQKIISAFKEKQIPVLLIGMEATMQHPPEYRDAFRQMYVDLAMENGLLWYPFFMQGLWADDGTQISSAYFLEDNMHPSVQGVSVMVKHMVPAVEQFMAEDIADVTFRKEP